MTVTIKDVAKEAGVAPSTVSRVIADNPSISQATKEKVRQVMADLHYYPNYNARRLASRRSRTVGIVLPAASDAFYRNPFFPTVLRGINEAASQDQYALLLSTGEGDQARLDHLQNMILGKQVEGLIFLYASREDPLLRFAMSQACPLVVIGHLPGLDVNRVDNDNPRIAYQATRHLIDRGARRLAFIGGDPKQQFVKERLAGFRQALEEAGLELAEGAIYNDLPFLQSAGYVLAQEDLLKQDFDGFVFADQLLAEGAYQAMGQAGIDPSWMVTFKAYSDAELGQIEGYPYFDLHSQELGYQAMQVLLEVLSQSEATKSQRYIYQCVTSDFVTKQ